MKKNKDKLVYPTLAIQLSNDMGLPYDMPDDWLETCMHIGAMLNAKYKCGLNITYGLVTEDLMKQMEDEVNENEG